LTIRRSDSKIDYSRFPVLFVDDEPENLRVFELAFRREFKIFTARNAREGLERIAANPAAVVLSDQRMPEMTGVDFLARVREIDPKTIRMLVTAYGDIDTLTDAINDGWIYRYIPKPWMPEEMRVTLRNAIEAYARETERLALVNELEILNDAGIELNRDLDFDSLLTRLLSLVVDRLRHDGATILIREPGEDVLRVARSAPEDSEVQSKLAALEIPLARAQCFAEVMERDQAQLLSLSELFDLEKPVREFAAEIAAEEILLVPLPGRDCFIGVLAVDNRRGGRPFDASARTLLSGIARQAAIALVNARLVKDLRSSREQTRRAERLGTLGTLAAGLAHEISNPLVSIQTFLSLAPEKRNTDDSEFWSSYHSLAVRELERIHSLLRNMSRLGTCTQNPPTPAPCDLGALARESVRLLEPAAQAGQIQVELELAPDLAKPNGVRDHLHQVILNLLLNAVHASAQGGSVALRVRCESGPAAPEQASRSDARRAVVEVQDWGHGIEPEVLEQIFDPFFTTKAPDQGSGLGLMIADRIVRDHGGSIEVESSVGHGSTFRVLLPV